MDDGGGAPAVVGMLLLAIDVVVKGPLGIAPLTGVDEPELVVPAATLAFCAAFTAAAWDFFK